MPNRSISYRRTLAISCLCAWITTCADAQERESIRVLEEITVTAIRVETKLQQTPLSIHVLTGEVLDVSGIDTGRELGIMVPNVVINPGTLGERTTSMIIRGLPGVMSYMDGIGTGDWGFLQRQFIELERIEVLRGPQGTYFGRNTNGGAIHLITRRPADAFGLRASIELGEFDRRTFRLAVDAPISDRLRTKWTVATDANDGFLVSRSAPFTLGSRDDSLLRADIVWQPNDDVSLRLTASRERMHSTDPRIIRLSNPDNAAYIALNVLAGNPAQLAEARAIDPAFPDPPLSLAGDRLTPETHEPGFPGGVLGDWQTMAGYEGAAISNLDQVTVTLDWSFGEHWALESMTALVDGDFRTNWDRDASEFSQYTGAGHDAPRVGTQELHLTGRHFDGRLRSLLGFWYVDRDWRSRIYRWVDWDFAIPNVGPSPPMPNPAAVEYVRAWGATIGNAAVASYRPLTFQSSDYINRGAVSERALFGELTVELRERLDLTLGLRVADDQRGSSFFYLPDDAFRPAVPGVVPPGDEWATGALLGGRELPDLGSVTMPRISLAYEPTSSLMMYASYAEGFSHGDIVIDSQVPDPIVLDPETVRTREIGLRSSWLADRLRFNATYFDSVWDGLVVPKRLDDPETGLPSPFISVPSSDGAAKSTGLEVELHYLPGERWDIDLALGLLDSEYLDVGDAPEDGGGLQPGSRLAYAPDSSYSVGARYRLPLENGSALVFAARYGWMNDYERAAESDLQSKNPDGTPKPEPSYGILNASVAYEPIDRAWAVSLFGTNLTNEWYVNGGTDPSLYIGYDFATIGRPREVGVALHCSID